jgi:hypothetical protein
MLLYTPATHRAALGTVLAIAAELDSGRTRQIDHGIAHLRLQWWREEAQRLARAVPSHPWLRTAHLEPQAASAALAALIEAAEIDLATASVGPSAGTSAARVGERLGAELFLQAARILVPTELRRPAPLMSGESLPLLDLGRCVAGLEQLAAPAAPLTWLRARQQSSTLIEPALQPPLAALLVWTATAAGQAQRRQRRAARGSATIAASPLDGFADNFTAWRCARAAARGRVRISIDESLG